jgi:hypothetical protein
MSVKTVLPILGVGSAFAIYGLARARRRSPEADNAAPPARPSGVHERVGPASDSDLSVEPLALGSEFWDAAPESELTEDATRPSVSSESYDTVDTEDLTAEWLTRATEAPPAEAASYAHDVDDPAEIPVDSVSMISDASRHAARLDLEDLDALDDENADDDRA